MNALILALMSSVLPDPVQLKHAGYSRLDLEQAYRRCMGELERLIILSLDSGKYHNCERKVRVVKRNYDYLKRQM